MRGMTIQRLRQIRARQDPPRYGADYVPSILATRSEAPSISRCTRIYWPRYGRDLHLLSNNEVAAALLALYSPQVSEIHEQRMLWTMPTTHPLTTRPRYRGPPLPGPRGTLAVSDRLDVLSLHPRIWVPNEQGKKSPVGYPFVGDLLLYINDSAAPGGERCVNWTVKRSSTDFTEPGPGKRRTPEQIARTIARTEIEETYYKDANIPTYRIADIDPHTNPWRNLRILYPYADLPQHFPSQVCRRVLDAYRRAVNDGTPITDIVAYLSHKLDYPVQELRFYYYHAIWRRQLPVDLFRPILINTPQNIETRNPLDVYAEWFSA